MDQNGTLGEILHSFNLITEKPEHFISPPANFDDSSKHLLKKVYDTTKQEETGSKKCAALPELIVENFDLEQIWQQIELQNDYFLGKSVLDVSKLAVNKDRLLFNNIVNNDYKSEDSESDDDDEERDENVEANGELEVEGFSEGNDISDEAEEEEDEEVDSGLEDDSMNKKKPKKSVVDDKFFKLNEMNEFLLKEEKQMNAKTEGKTNLKDSDSESDESMDLFGAGSGDEDNEFEGNDKLKNPRYKDFFRKKDQMGNEESNENENNEESGQSEADDFFENNDEEENDDADENDDKNENKSKEDKPENETKSTFELREERLKAKIKRLEAAAVSEKPWQLKGEVTADKRPQNSLLQEVLEYDLVTRPAPVITEETTHVLEDVIRRRIKDKAFDDVQRKEKPVQTPLEFKKKLLLDQEKSKESLAQIYEKEFLQQKEALNVNAADKEEEIPQLHQEIEKMMHSLFTKLDALSNFHFTPKPAAPEIKIVSNLPAISMEEVAPVAASDAMLLAPEEIKRKSKGDVVGKSERTDADKKRERRKKRQKQRLHANEKQKRENAVNKLRPGLGNKYSKEKARKMLEKESNVEKLDERSNKIKSSTAFFSELEDQVRSEAKGKIKRKTANPSINAKRMKL